ncbi:MAG: alpha/beta hydrolase [Acidimicrobiales bacterium]|jgi:pimeloyl-ACP methyl ester carboxylesterase
MQVKANGIDLEAETFGDPADPPVLLIMGLGFQLVHWPVGFVEQLVSQGFYVIRFDNRDVGRSTWFDNEPRPNAPLTGLKGLLGIRPKVAYTLSDMASDAVGVLDALGIESAHIVGMSMGGMIAQRVAIDHPERTRSLCSIMSSEKLPATPLGFTLKLMALGANPKTREKQIESSLKMFRLLDGGGFAFDEEPLSQLAVEVVDRAWHPAGTDRQHAAIVADGDRRPGLAKLKTPTVVVHGTADPLIPPKHGQQTADAIPGAEMVWIEGMGHELPEGAWPALVEAIIGSTKRAGV